MFSSLFAFIGWLVLPHIVGVATFALARTILRRWSTDDFPAQFFAVLVVPIFAISSLGWFGPAAADGARRCGAWGAFVFFTTLPAVGLQFFAAILVQATLGMIRETSH